MQIIEEQLKLVKTFNPHQSEVFKLMNKNNKYQICLPTGVGKGYVMNVQIKHDLVKDISNRVVICSHRLTLNTQHLDDIIEVMLDMIEDVRFIVIGSQKVNHAKMDKHKTLRKVFYQNGFTSKDMVKQTTYIGDIDKWVEQFEQEGKKIIIISTYHSLNKLAHVPVDTIYCDEAHTLASENNTSAFKQNFNIVKFKRSFFFTATPKDAAIEADITDETFLMNNKKIFGERYEMTLKSAYELGYIAKPIIHISVPKHYANEDMNRVRNKVAFILQCFKTHNDCVKNSNDTEDDMEPKLLVRCENVNQMWKIYNSLLSKNLQNIELFAGASRKDVKGAPSYQKNGVDIPKNQHLAELKNLKNSDRAIVLHVDTLSEGVNVKNFTGVMFLANKIPTITKLLQNIGRSTRVVDTDRKKLKAFQIATGEEYYGWLKPYAFIILPIYDPDSKHTVNYIAKLIGDLKLEIQDTTYLISIGDDINIGNNISQDPLVDPSTNDRNKKLIGRLKHIFDQEYNKAIDMKTQNKINSMDDLELLSLLQTKCENND